MYLRSGVAPIKQMMMKDIPIALGTDGSASNNSQDILEALKIAMLLSRCDNLDASALSAQDGIKMITQINGKILQRDDIGHLSVRAKADVTIIDVNKTKSVPVTDPITTIVFSGSESFVKFVIVDGTILLENGRPVFVDENELIDRCTFQATKLRNKFGHL